MADRFIPIAPYQSSSTLRPSDAITTASGVLMDTLNRPLRDLRISVTDRCNFRCTYCMPREIFDQDYPYLPQRQLLTFEEITRIANLLVAQGVTKLRLTGGEPLLRKNLDSLISMLRQIETPNGLPLDIALTTNGALLAQKASQLKRAGLNRVTVSLDAIDDTIFKQMTDADFSVADVLHGLDVAQQVGLKNIKVNMVVKAGVNDSQILPMARHFKNTQFVLRFIEYMDVGTSNGWTMNDVISSREVINLISQSSMDMRLESIESNGETAQRWRYVDDVGEIGVISSVTQAFCGDCTRLRLSTEGKLYTCLFASHGYDVRELLRSNVEDQAIAGALARVWQTRKDRYSELRGKQTNSLRKIEMSYIGG